MHARFSAAGFHNVRSYGWILRFDSFFRTPKHSKYGHSTTLRHWPQFANQACEQLAAQAFRLQTSPLGAAWCHILSHPISSNLIHWWFSGGFLVVFWWFSGGFLVVFWWFMVVSWWFMVAILRPQALHGEPHWRSDLGRFMTDPKQRGYSVTWMKTALGRARSQRMETAPGSLHIFTLYINN